MAKQRAVYRGLQFIPTYVTDTSPASPDVFKITKLPLRFTAGKNLIKIQGNTNNLKVGTRVEVEVLDYNGNPIYSEFINYSKQIERYLSLFHQKQVKIILFDEFKNYTTRTYREILESI